MSGSRRQVKDIKDGGQAYPGKVTVKDENRSVWVKVDDPGMTLRQWYAGMALQSMAIHQVGEIEENSIVEQAFAYADAMIAHEEKERR